MLLVIGTVRLPAGRLDAARPAMAAMIEASRAEQGCLHYSYAEDVLDAGLIHVKELWIDRAALDWHFRSAPIAVWRTTWPSLGIGERRLSLYQVGEPEAV